MPRGSSADAVFQSTRARRTPALGAMCGVPQIRGSFPWERAGTFAGWSHQGQAQPRLTPSPPHFCPFWAPNADTLQVEVPRAFVLPEDGSDREVSPRHSPRPSESWVR